MKRYIIQFLFLISQFLTGCDTENPFVDKEIIEQIRQQKAPKPTEHFALLIKDEIYYLKDFNHLPKKLTNSSVAKKMVKINHGRNKIAYLNSSGSPVIIDTSGVVVDKLIQYKNVKQMDWSSDDKSIYMLIDDKIQVYGASKSIPAISKEPTETVLSVAVSANNDLYYILQYSIGINQYSQKLVIKKSNNESTTISKSSGEIRMMKSVNLSKDGSCFMISYSKSVWDNYLCKVQIYQLNTNYPYFEWEVDGKLLDPKYDDYSKYLVCAISDSYEDNFVIKAIYTAQEFDEESRDKYLSGYSAGEKSVSLDWK